MVFKKFKILKKRLIEQKKTTPVIKHLKIHNTHVNQKKPIDIIFILLCTKRNTGLRKILELSQFDLDKNRYMLIKKLLEISLDENYENDLTIKILQKICKHADFVNELLWEYLKVAILSNRNYKKLFMFCFKQNNKFLITNKKELENIVEDVELNNLLKKVTVKTTKYKFFDKILYENAFL